ncbi:MAG: NAD(P)/FAD-dependent oxidoreductase [Flavobacteriaceae bacterium]|nr:NAD(P)/FAD-dependent oxidoreductase [Flavobacteriaceae bacterium]
MDENSHYDVVIVGGGLAGLTAALHLSTVEVRVLLIEQHEYPNHKVCGEYLSNEILDYLKYLGVDPLEAGAVEIDELEISTINGKKVRSKLPLGGFGISRFALDALMFNAVKEEMDVVIDTVVDISFDDDIFRVNTQNGETFSGTYVLGAFGKRSKLDKSLQREFILKKSRWLAVKCHYDYRFPSNLVALHNFTGGYCGLSKVENDKVNACYLVTYDSFKKVNDIEEFQQKVMSENKHLKHFFENAMPVFEKPLAIGQISFDSKKLVEDHILMIGDSAGLIHPLCGNGMSMAIHSAKMVSEILLSAVKCNINRNEVETYYSKAWKKTFSSRLRTGRIAQRILLNQSASEIGFRMARAFPGILPGIIKSTHGEMVEI